jgi:hypothetical protein
MHFKVYKYASLFRLSNIFYRIASAKPKLYFLIGPPAVGKSTWIAQNAPGATVCNRDEEVVRAAQQTGVGTGTYDDMFERPSADILGDLKVPTKEVMQAAEGGDASARAEVDDFITKITLLADEYNIGDDEKIKMYGKIAPYDYETLRKIIIDFGVPTQFIGPFEYIKVREANELVAQNFDAVRSGAVEGGEDIVIDMTNMNKGSRDSHRKFIVSVKEGIDPGSADPNRVNEYYNQIAVVFSSPEGYSEEEREKIKQIAHMRAESIKAQGGSKTIPDSAFDRMFMSFEPPDESEGFSDIQYVGIPSLNALT